MVKDRESMRRELLEQIVEAGELYLNLGDYVRAHEMTKIPRGKIEKNKIEPQLDMIVLKNDIWHRIRELVQKIPSV